jgi:hypothetical protein
VVQMADSASWSMPSAAFVRSSSARQIPGGSRNFTTPVGWDPSTVKKVRRNLGLLQFWVGEELLKPSNEPARGRSQKSTSPPGANNHKIKR